jgi:hypothetical protein
LGKRGVERNVYITESWSIEYDLFPSSVGFVSRGIRYFLVVSSRINYISGELSIVTRSWADLQRKLGEIWRSNFPRSISDSIT